MRYAYLFVPMVVVGCVGSSNKAEIRPQAGNATSAAPAISAAAEVDQLQPRSSVPHTTPLDGYLVTTVPPISRLELSEGAKAELKRRVPLEVSRVESDVLGAIVHSRGSGAKRRPVPWPLGEIRARMFMVLEEHGAARVHWEDESGDPLWTYDRVKGLQFWNWPE